MTVYNPDSITGLLIHYQFDLGDDTARKLVTTWLENYDPQWVCWAVVEAIYQGRYKAISVNQMLTYWQRRQKPIYNFPPAYERMISENYIGNSKQESLSPSQKLMDTEKTAERVLRSLNPEETPPATFNKSSHNNVCDIEINKSTTSDQRGQKAERMEKVSAFYPRMKAWFEDDGD